MKPVKPFLSSLNLPFVALWAGVLFYSNSALAFSMKDVSVEDMLKNIAAASNELMSLLTAIAYVMGFFFMIKGIIALRAVAEHRTSMSGHAELKGPLAYLAVGAALCFLPSSIQVGLSTFWHTPNPYVYESILEEYDDAWSSVVKSAFIVVQLIGTLALVRGLAQLTHTGGHGGGQPASLGRALAHIIGGIFCINIYQFLNAIFITLGVGPM